METIYNHSNHSECSNSMVKIQIERLAHTSAMNIRNITEANNMLYVTQPSTNLDFRLQYLQLLESLISIIVRFTK